MTPETILGAPRRGRGADWRILDAARGVLGTDWGIDAQARPLGEGIIHDTFIVEGAGDPLVLQRVNGSVFPDLDLLMENVARVSAHLSAKQPAGRRRSCRLPRARPLPARAIRCGACGRIFPAPAPGPRWQRTGRRTWWEPVSAEPTGGCRT